MNKDIKNKVDEINFMLKNNEIITRYNNAYEALINNKEITDLEDRLKELQKEMKKELEDANSENKEIVIKQFNELKDKLKDDPLYSTYESYKEEVNDLLIQIEDVLNTL